MASVSESRIGVRLSAAQRQTLLRIAAATGESLSTITRRALANGLRFEQTCASR